MAAQGQRASIAKVVTAGCFAHVNVTLGNGCICLGSLGCLTTNTINSCCFCIAEEDVASIAKVVTAGFLLM